MSDIYGEGDRVERALNLLRESDLSDSNKSVLEEFLYNLMAEDISGHKIYRYLQSFRSMEPVLDFELEDAEKSDVVKLAGKINHNQIPGKDYGAYSRKELKMALSKFYSFLTEEDEPEILESLSLTIKKSDRSRVNPDRLPTPSTVKAMKNEANNPRDKLLVVLLWESGARIGELLNLDWEDLEFIESAVKVDLDGKTGPRPAPVPVVESRILLENWKKCKDSSESGAIFSSFQGGNRIKYNTARKQLIKMAENAGVEKKVNPHAFRKSRATWMASKGANIFQLMRFFGWEKSETALTYVRLAQSSVDELVLRLSRQSDLTEYENRNDSLVRGSANPEHSSQEVHKQALEALKSL